MAGSQNFGEASDNPVGINVVPMVDVIFCLCLFFMTSLNFKSLEGKIEAWLPKDHGNQHAPVPPPTLEEVPVRLRIHPVSGKLVRKVGAREVSSDAELAGAILAWPKSRELSVALDAGSDVPWSEAVRVLDVCRRHRIDRVEFAEPWAPPAPARR